MTRMTLSTPKPLIILGGGGHAKVLIDILLRLSCKIIGIIDPHLPINSKILGFNILGDDQVVLDYPPTDIELINGIGSLPNDSRLRVHLFNYFKNNGYQFKTVIDPTAYIAKETCLSEGVQIMAGAIIQVGTNIACNTIANSGSIIEHDCEIGQHVHIAPGAVLSGAVKLSDYVHIGTGAKVIQGIHIGAHSIIGAGSTVTKNIESHNMVFPPKPFIQPIGASDEG